MIAPRSQLVGNVVHVDFWVRDAATAVGFGWARLARGAGGDGAGHEGDYVRRAVVCGEEDGVEGGHVVVHGAVGADEGQRDAKRKGCNVQERTKRNC